MSPAKLGKALSSLDSLQEADGDDNSTDALSPILSVRKGKVPPMLISPKDRTSDDDQISSTDIDIDA